MSSPRKKQRLFSSIRYILPSLKDSLNTRNISHTPPSGIWSNKEIFFILNRTRILCKIHDINCRTIVFSTNDKFWYSEFKTPLNFYKLLIFLTFFHGYFSEEEKKAYASVTSIMFMTGKTHTHYEHCIIC